MTNPSGIMRMLVTYAICIAAAIAVGFLLTNPLDYGNVGFLGLIVALILSPVFIKWHYPIMVFGLACPMTLFFLKGSPSLGQVVVLMSLGIAIVERTLSSERPFIRVPAITWPLLFIGAMVFLTAKLTGGIGLQALGGGMGGGRKYIAVFVGIATYFALTSQKIPEGQRKWYLALYMLPAVMGVIGDLFPFLPSPLNIINLLFPPSMSNVDEVEIGTTRLVSFAFTMGAIPSFLIARYGLRGIFLEGKLWRPALFMASIALSMLGGFRNVLLGYMVLFALMFFLEGLHRTRLVPALLLACVLGSAILATCSDKLPYTFQRSMCFLPLKWKTEVLLDAQGSNEWRYRIWRAIWPKVPDYLLLGKGYSLSKTDYEMMQGGTFANFQASHISGDEESLAISNDFHSGPLSTLIGFGIWGAIGMVWLMGATVFVVYRNYQFGDPTLRIFNAYMLASCISYIFFFFFIFGAFDNDIGGFARMAGFSIAMNWGVAKRPPQPAAYQHLKPRPDVVPQPA